MKNLGDTVQWLMQEEQKGLFEILVALALNLIFLALMALLLWPLGHAALAWQFARGYGILWVVTVVASQIVNRLQALFKVNLYDHPDAYVISNLLASCFLQVGWSTFAALSIYPLSSGGAGLDHGDMASCRLAFVSYRFLYRVLVLPGPHLQAI